MRLAFLTLTFILIPNVILAQLSIQKFVEEIAKYRFNENNSLSPHVPKYTRISPRKLIRQANFPSETHKITTEDGYILKVHRIPGPPNSTAVLLQHGLLESSADWLHLGRGKSLAYILAERGYDVWLGNARGNTYSRRHQNLTTADPRFWNFTWEELGRYDQPAVITYITNLKRDSLFYIGHSMGATSFSVMAIERPDVASKVKAMIGLAPATYVYHTRNFLKLLAPFWEEFQAIKSSLGLNEFLPHSILFDVFANVTCTVESLNDACKVPLFILAGSDAEKLDNSLLPNIWRSFPAGTSTKLFTHFLQQIHLNKFRRFDYGMQTNLQVYGRSEPPLYDLSKVRVPIAVFWSANDWIVGPQDVKKFYRKVPLKSGIFKVKDTKYNHFDFLWAKDAPQLVYDDVLNVMRNYESSANGN